MDNTISKHQYYNCFTKTKSRMKTDTLLIKEVNMEWFKYFLYLNHYVEVFIIFIVQLVL